MTNCVSLLKQDYEDLNIYVTGSDMQDYVDICNLIILLSTQPLPARHPPPFFVTLLAIHYVKKHK